MKKITAQTKKLAVVALVLLASMLPATAADFMVDSIYYNIISDGEVEVTTRDSGKYSGEVIIPSTVMNDGITYRVTRIGDGSFSSCRDLTLVDIPEGITVIGYSAFSGCSNLENVDLPNSLVTIDRYAFNSCSSFTTFNIPRNVAEIGYRALYGCRNLKYYTCSSMSQHFRAVDGVLYSKDMSTLFQYPPAAPAITFDVPSPVSILHEYCFADCDNLVQVNLPETLRTVEMNVFRGCVGLETAYIPDGVTWMGVTVFGDCTNLTSVHLPASVDSLMSSTFMNCQKLTEVTIPRNVKYIGDFFSYHSALKNINFEEGSQLETIGFNAFFDTWSLERFDMPNSVTTVEYQAFYNCRSLKWVHLSENLRNVGTSVFCYCNSLEECEIPGTVLELKNVMARCPALKRLKIGSKDSAPGVTLLKNMTIVECDQLEYLELGANVDSLESDAIYGVSNLKVLISWAAVPPRCDAYWHSFYPTPKQITAPLYVRKASLEAYRTTKEWQDFSTIVAIEDVGDVNADGIINISDALALINHLSVDGPVSAPLADVNLDGEITITDVTALLNRLLNE